MASEAASADPGGCTSFDQSTGGCSTGTISGDHVDLGAATGSGSAEAGSGASQPSDDAAAGDDQPPANTTGTTCKGVGKCDFRLGEAGIQQAGPGVVMSDLASFYPQSPTVTSEPNGWAVIGLDANFVSDAARHTASGSLLGQPASVRFTPVTFRWDYGDGARGTTATGGRTWAQLGVPEFSPTATSHIYTAEGSYGITLTVEYVAQYSIASGPWQGVPGTLRLSAPTFTVIAADAKTVLVQRNCDTDPRGPGC
jgi:hypothetical protein